MTLELTSIYPVELTFNMCIPYSPVPSLQFRSLFQPGNGAITLPFQFQLSA